MKNLIKIIKVFYCVCLAIFVATIYALLTRGIEWLFFSFITFFMAYSLRREIKGMEEDIQTALNTAVKAIWQTCYNREPGVYDVEYLHNNNWYYFTIDYYATYKEVVGTEFMGRYEYLTEKVDESIRIIDFECRNDLTDEITDCGFTIEDIENAL